MTDPGKYQNEITSLRELELEDYERIFKIFKKSLNDKDFYTYNILKKIEFPKIGDKFLEYYDVKSKLALTTLSYNIYGDIKSWWIIYLLNKDKFTGAPFFINPGTSVRYISKYYKSAIYSDITKDTLLRGKHTNG